MSTDAWIDLLLAMLGGAVRVGTPFLFVSIGLLAEQCFFP